MAEAYYDLGLKLLDQGKPDAACEYFHTALGLKPDFPNANYALATAQLAQRDRRPPRSILRRPCGDAPTMWRHREPGHRADEFERDRRSRERIRRGDSLRSRKCPTRTSDWDSCWPDRVMVRAAQEFQATFLADPRRADAHFELANLYVAAQDLRRAADEYQAAVRLQPDYFAAWQNLGAASLSLGDIPQAIKQFTEALRLQPDNPQAHQSRTSPGTATATGKMIESCPRRVPARCLSCRGDRTYRPVAGCGCRATFCRGSATDTAIQPSWITN